MHNQRKIGVVLNYFNLLLRIVSSFWVTRIVVNTLGTAEYGLISMAGSILAILPLLDFGMTAAITRYTAEYKARNDMDGLKDFLGLCQKFFYGVAFLSALVCVFLYFRIDDIFFNKTEDELYKIKVMFIMLASGSVINFTQCIYTNVLNALQQFVFTTLLGTFTLVSTALGSVLFVWNGYGAIGITAVGLGLHLIFIFPARFYCWRKLNLVPNLRYWNWALLKKCLNYSVWVFFGTMSGMLGEHLAPLIIGSACTAADAGVYRVGTIITGYLLMASSVSAVFFPKVIEMVTHNASRKQLTNCFIRVGRIDFMISILFVGGFFLIGKEFFQLWVERAGGLWEAQDTALAWKVGMICSSFVPIAASFGVGWQILQAKNLLKFRVLVSLGTNLIGSGLGYFLALKYGLFGLLWSRFTFPGLILVVFTIFYFEKVAGLDMKSFLKNTYTKTLIPLAIGSLCTIVILSYHPVHTWFDFIVIGGVYTGIFIIAAWMLVMNCEEKTLIRNLFLKVRHLLKKATRKIIR